jgi:small redox-active disulfide protein 2
MLIQILGPGCPNCERLAEIVRRAVTQLGIDATIVKVKDMDKIEKYGLLFTPGLVIDGKLVCGGRVPSLSEVKEWLAEAARIPSEGR